MIGPSYYPLLQILKSRFREVNDLVSDTHLGPELYSESNAGFFTPHLRRIFSVGPSFLNLAGPRLGRAWSNVETGHSYGAGETHTDPGLR